MATNSSALNALLIIFAIIGAFAVLAFVGMIFMHGSMMGMMSGSDMATACQNMLSR